MAAELPRCSITEVQLTRDDLEIFKSLSHVRFDKFPTSKNVALKKFLQVFQPKIFSRWISRFSFSSVVMATFQQNNNLSLAHSLSSFYFLSPLSCFLSPHSVFSLPLLSFALSLSPALARKLRLWRKWIKSVVTIIFCHKSFLFRPKKPLGGGDRKKMPPTTLSSSKSS